MCIQGINTACNSYKGEGRQWHYYRCYAKIKENQRCVCVCVWCMHVGSIGKCMYIHSEAKGGSNVMFACAHVSWVRIDYITRPTLFLLYFSLLIPCWCIAGGKLRKKVFSLFSTRVTFEMGFFVSPFCSKKNAPIKLPPACRCIMGPCVPQKITSAEIIFIFQPATRSMLLHRRRHHYHHKPRFWYRKGITVVWGRCCVRMILVFSSAIFILLYHRHLCTHIFFCKKKRY